MSDIEFGIDIQDQDLMEFAEKGRKAVALAIKYTALDVWGGVRKRAPTDHGRLAGSFQIQEDREMDWRIFSNVHYALHVHEGTGIYGPHKHPIVPVRAKALKFFWKKTGQVMIFKGDLPNSWQKRSFANWAEDRGMTPVFAWVKGMEGRPYADWAIEDASLRTEDFIERAIQETVGETA